LTERDYVLQVITHDNVQRGCAGVKSRAQPAGRRFVEFFIANIRKPEYPPRLSPGGLRILRLARLGLSDIEPVRVAAYVAQLCSRTSKTTVKTASGGNQAAFA
jgi:hypothetical protein